MNYQAVVLLSGGLDSTVNLYGAHKEWGSVLALSFNYGQKAFPAEYAAAEYLCKKLGIPNKLLDISNIFSLDGSALTSDEKDIPTNEVDIESQQASEKSAEKVWVANRNGVFLNIAACWAESVGAQYIVPGFNREEAQTFPDNSVEYIEQVNRSLKYSTNNGVKVHCFTQSMDKIEIMKQAKEWEVPVDKIWSCYYNGEKPCGRCESCQRFQRALEGVEL
ncbi:MAG: 7-cyano-7-deazaguanine synthase QueC [Bdellovibrionales bacterium]|nr:7-cyano-7-deazaguanine synthase QueC [Bdellovibrionales bacterium]NQZ19322.1 7-cyano-7-deazaguanine synthase QueC [Bdellovibrionales bacterium]